MAKNLPANAEDTGSIPHPGRSYMLRSKKARVSQLLRVSALEPVLWNKRSHRNETPAHHN